MKELSLHILDIAQNSIKANASTIEILVEESIQNDVYSIEIKDNGDGMEEQMLQSITNPYVTTQSTRNVGLGIPLFEQSAKQAGGSLNIHSEKGKGTIVKAVFSHSHIDRPIMGDIAGTLTILFASEPDIRFIYTHSTPLSDFDIDSFELKNELEGVPLHLPEIIKEIKSIINENLMLIEATLK
jgi:hypothetical protein